MVIATCSFCFVSKSNWQHISHRGIKTAITPDFKNIQEVGRRPLLGHQFSLCLSPYISALTRPSPLSLWVKPHFSYLHISMASPALHTIIISPSPPPPQIPGHLSFSLPHLSISVRLGTAGVPMTTPLDWLLLMWNLPSSHLLDVHQQDTERDRRSERLHLLMEWTTALLF